MKKTPKTKTVKPTADPVTGINVPLLLKVRKTILARPEQFNMNYWFVDDADTPNCGTACCIAGWAVTAQDQKGKRGKLRPSVTAKKLDPDYGEQISHYAIDRDLVFDKAQAALGLNLGQAERLFYDDQWPAQFKQPFSTYRYANDMTGCARIAAERIDHFIATNGEE